MYARIVAFDVDPTRQINNLEWPTNRGKNKERGKEEKTKKKSWSPWRRDGQRSPFVAESKGIAVASVSIPPPGSPFFVSDRGFDVSETTTTPIAGETNNALPPGSNDTPRELYLMIFSCLLFFFFSLSLFFLLGVYLGNLKPDVPFKCPRSRRLSNGRRKRFASVSINAPHAFPVAADSLRTENTAKKGTGRADERASRLKIRAHREKSIEIGRTWARARNSRGSSQKPRSVFEFGD